MGIGFAPILGDLYDATVFLTGYDPITGESVRSVERALLLLAVLPFVSAGMVRGLGDVFALSRQAGRRHRSCLATWATPDGRPVRSYTSITQSWAMPAASLA